jgi:hypothetical protein
MTMDHIDDEPLTPEEQAALAALPREIAPPAEIESRTVAAVRASGAFTPRRSTSQIWGAVAAAAVVFLAGYSTAQLTQRATQTVSTGGRYLFLLYDTPGTLTADPSAGPRLFEEYSAWYTREHAAGVVESGDKLDDAVIRTVGPELQAAPQPAGLFVIRARSTDEAVAIARESPTPDTAAPSLCGRSSNNPM